MVVSRETKDKEMTDRDFKLLVIEERRLRAMNPSIDLEPKLHKKFQEVKKLLEKELEAFTEQEQQELPFKD